MKKIILFLLISLWGATTFGQDIFVTKEFTDNGKQFHKMINYKYFILEKESPDRVSFKVIQNKIILLDGYLTKCVILEKGETPLYIVETRRMTVISRLDGTTEHTYLFTTMVDKATQQITKISISILVNNIVKRSYLGNGN